MCGCVGLLRVWTDVWMCGLLDYLNALNIMSLLNYYYELLIL